jgi:hypothetical protein
MKKLILILSLLITLTLTAQTVIYQPNNAVISNPEKGFYHYTSTVAGVGIVSNQISTTDGAVLEAKIYNTSGTVVSRKVDVSDLPNGIYIVKAKTSQGNSIIQKIRIQR